MWGRGGDSPVVRKASDENVLRIQELDGTGGGVIDVGNPHGTRGGEANLPVVSATGDCHLSVGKEDLVVTTIVVEGLDDQAMQVVWSQSSRTGVVRADPARDRLDASSVLGSEQNGESRVPKDNLLLGSAGNVARRNLYGGQGRNPLFKLCIVIRVFSESNCSVHATDSIVDELCVLDVGALDDMLFDQVLRTSVNSEVA